MSMKEIAYEIEELQVEAEKIHSMNEALYAAVYLQNDFEIEMYEWAFVLFIDMTIKLRDDLKELMNKAVESFRQGAA